VLDILTQPVVGAGSSSNVRPDRTGLKQMFVRSTEDGHQAQLGFEARLQFLYRDFRSNLAQGTTTSGVRLKIV
jgi:hypothetical protein